MKCDEEHPVDKNCMSRAVEFGSVGALGGRYVVVLLLVFFIEPALELVLPDNGHILPSIVVVIENAKRCRS